MDTKIEKLNKEREEINLQVEILNKIIMEKGARLVEISNKISDILDKEEARKEQDNA